MLSHFSLNLVPRFHCFLSAPFELFLRTSGALPFAGVLFPSLQKPHLRNMCFAFRKCSCLRTAGRERVGAVWAGSDEAEMGTRGDRGLLLGGLPWSTFVSFFDGDGLTKVFRSFEGGIGFLGGGLTLGFPSPLPLTKGGFGPQRAAVSIDMTAVIPRRLSSRFSKEELTGLGEGFGMSGLHSVSGVTSDFLRLPDDGVVRMDRLRLRREGELS